MTFEIAGSKSYPRNEGYDLVSFFDCLQDMADPVGAASTTICTPASLSQEVGAALGAQAGEERLREVVTAGGFTRFRRAPKRVNLVFETRP